MHIHWLFTMIYIKGRTQMASNPHQITSADLFYFFMPPKLFNKLFEFSLYKTNRLRFSVCVYCNRSQKTSQRVRRTTVTALVSCRSFFSLHAVTLSMIYYSTHARKNVTYLLNNRLTFNIFFLKDNLSRYVCPNGVARFQ